MPFGRTVGSPEPHPLSILRQLDVREVPARLAEQPVQCLGGIVLDLQPLRLRAMVFLASSLMAASIGTSFVGKVPPAGLEPARSRFPGPSRVQVGRVYRFHHGGVVEEDVECGGGGPAKTLIPPPLLCWGRSTRPSQPSSRSSTSLPALHLDEEVQGGDVRLQQAEHLIGQIDRVLDEGVRISRHSQPLVPLRWLVLTLPPVMVW